jgi:hypothetical protein
VLMSPTTSTGWRYTRLSLPGASVGSIRTPTRYGSEAASSSTPCTACHSSDALSCVLPDSCTSHPTISSCRASITAAARRIGAARWPGIIAAHPRSRRSMDAGRGSHGRFGRSATVPR